MAYGYLYKVYQSGNVIEVYEYDEMRFKGFQRSQSYGKSNATIRVVDEETGEIITRKMTEEEFEEYIEKKGLISRAKSNIRARNNIRRIALSNFDNKSTFLTLTFQENIQDLDLANEVFQRFVKYMREDLRKKNCKFKYLAVIEFQKRGAIHYHLLCNLPTRYSFKKVRERWRQAIKALGVAGTGSTKQNRIDEVDNVGAYIIKYMTKEEADERLIGRKMYRPSHGLKRSIPKEFKTREELEEYLNYFGINEDTEDTKKAYHDSYTDSFTLGQVNYTEYNLKR
ncbi:helitron helicase-like domain-containing protein [Vagococcus lutrae]|uniref:helitron helicase-like domain-containing protein n=1 Tax=Vagococcus lutrae TaxID=81947 RepID=UPI0020986540|nr:helitron helicase-like domain-containing protein [Vagococcus lutrae]MCO7151938.1 helitron helicase-like domain-containing protein [Vagococcus lutrae]